MSNPAPRRLNVFVSSVYKELVAYRAAVIDAIWRCNCFPIGMDRLDVALPYSPIVSSRKMVDEADIYIGLFSQRYGEITALEYQWAVELHKPILIFDSATSLNPDDQETIAEHAALLAGLKQELRTNYVVASFASGDELSKKVYESLTLVQNQQTQPSTAPTTRARDRAITPDIPSPPKPYYAHPYFLGMQFFGRQTDLAQLDIWAQAPEPVMVIDAIGGAGKSALTWHWLRDHSATAFPNPDGIVWWSFYEADATLVNLLRQMLAYFNQQPISEYESQPRFELERQVITLLETRRVLLVLDGIERLLLAYRRLDAAHLTDEAVDQDLTVRSCSDPRDGAFLRRLSLCERSKILISSRLVPQDLQDRHSQQLLAGVRNIHLYGMTPPDALAMFEGLGVHGNHEIMRTLLGQFGDHALLIGVLAGRIRAYRPAPGDFDAWYADQGNSIRLESPDLKQRRTSILSAALADLDPALFLFLGQIAAFRYPVEYEVLLAMNPFLPASGAESDQQAKLAGVQRLNQALAELEERELVQWERATNRYDLHPVVRAYAYDHLEDRAGAYDRILSYFEAQPEEDTEAVQDVSQLRRTLEIYYALLNSGQLQAAYSLYRTRFGNALYYALGAYQTMVECLLPFFPRGIDQLPELSLPYEQAFVMNSLATAFGLLGDEEAALTLYGQTFPLALSNKDTLNLSIRLINFSIAVYHKGELARSIQCTKLSLDLARASDDTERITLAQLDLVAAYTACGNFAEAELAYQEVQARPTISDQTYAFKPRYAARLRFYQGGDPEPDLIQAVKEAEMNRYIGSLYIAYQLQGEVALARKDLFAAESGWLTALELAQRQGIPLARCHGDLARLRVQQGRMQEARDLIEQALAEGTPDLEAAEVYLALGERELAHKYVLPAYKSAWADGPPYTFFDELRRARAVIAALGMAEPELPAYDPAKVRPIPHEAAIRAFIAELEQAKAAAARDDEAADDEPEDDEAADDDQVADNMGDNDLVENAAQFTITAASEPEVGDVSISESTADVSPDADSNGEQTAAEPLIQRRRWRLFDRKQ